MSRSVDPTPAKLATLDPRLRGPVVALLNFVRSQGVPLIVISGRRSATRNREIGGARRSKHLMGRAVDVQVQGLLREQVPLQYWHWMGSVGEFYGLRWGGRFRTPDLNHFDAGA